MSTAIPAIPNGQGTDFFPMEKNAIRSYTHVLPESPLLSNHISAIIEFSPTAKEKPGNKKKTRGLLTSDSGTEISSNGRKLTWEEQKEESDDVTKTNNADETTDTTLSHDLILNYKNPFNSVESVLYTLA